MTGGRPLWRAALVILACSAAAVVVLSSSVRYTDADPQGTLLVGQQMLTRGTVSLDALSEWTADNYRVVQVNGSWFYFFPPGAPIAALPAVAMALALGIDVQANEGALQMLVSALIAAITVLLLITVARFFLGLRMSVVLALAFWAATPLSSTNGTALWSHGPAVVWGLVALVALLAATERGRAWCWWPLAASLFMAILSRPTMTLFAAALLAYAVARDRRTAWRAALLLALLLATFMIGTWILTRELIPPYYQPGRVSGGEVLSGLTGVLASPSRGLVVYLPWLPLLALTAWLTRTRWRDHRLLVAVNGAWVLALLVVVARFPLWYGGSGYGPRLLTDAMPSLFVILAATWPHRWPRTWIPLMLAWLVAAVLGLAQHTVAGLFNPSTGEWNRSNSRDMSEFVNDWRFPQFLHTEQRQDDRERVYVVTPPEGVGYRDLPVP